MVFVFGYLCSDLMHVCMGMLNYHLLLFVFGWKGYPCLQLLIDVRIDENAIGRVGFSCSS